VEHLALPLRIVGARMAYLAQDTDADVAQCCEVVARYRPGVRLDDPDFGLPDQAHQQGGADLAEIASVLQAHEPRAAVAAESLGTDPLGLAQRVLVRAGRRTV
jgi:hypothetical protein